MIRVVISTTTLPDQYSKLLKTLQSLHNQSHKPDAIYLSLPSKCRRLGTDYPPIPTEISELCTIVPCTDYGPITKLLGALLMEDDPSTIIISADNDRVYGIRNIEELLYHHEQYPDSAIGSSGMLLKYSCPACAILPNEDNFLYRIPKFSVPPEGRRVDSLYGYPGVLYIRKFFPIKEELEDKFLKYALINDNMLLNDDIVISGYLSLHNIERRIFANMPIVAHVVDDTGVRQRNDTEISYNVDKFFQRMKAAIHTTKSIGMYEITEPLDITETVVGIGAILTISILILILASIYLIWSPHKLYLI